MQISHSHDVVCAGGVRCHAAALLASEKWGDGGVQDVQVHHRRHPEPPPRRSAAAFVVAMDDAAHRVTSSASTCPALRTARHGRAAVALRASGDDLGLLAFLPKHLRWRWRPRLPPTSLHQHSVGGAGTHQTVAADAANAVGTIASRRRHRSQGGLLGDFFFGLGMLPQAEEMAFEAIAQASIAEEQVLKAVQQANDAAKDALAAAQVAVWTEFIGVVGTLAGLAASYIGFRMDDTQLPEDIKLPDTARGLPEDLLRPPPGTRVESSARGRRGRGELRHGGDDRIAPAGPDGPLDGA